MTISECWGCQKTLIPFTAMKDFDATETSAPDSDIVSTWKLRRMPKASWLALLMLNAYEATVKLNENLVWQSESIIF